MFLPTSSVRQVELKRLLKVFSVSSLESERDMLREVPSNLSSEKKGGGGFHLTVRKQTAQGVCFMNEQKPNLQKRLLGMTAL